MHGDKNPPIVVDRKDHRVIDLIKMGQNLGLPLMEWYACLKMATLLLEEMFESEGIRPTIEAKFSACLCDKCVAEVKVQVKRGGMHVVD